MANNEILDSFQPTINNLSEKFTEVNLKLENKNFHKDFAYISQLILDKNFDTKFIELKTKLENKNFNTHFNKIEEVIINEKNSIVAVLNKNHNKLNSQIDKQEIEIKALKKYLLVFFSILIIGLVLLAFAGIIILKPSLF